MNCIEWRLRNAIGRVVLPGAFALIFGGSTATAAPQDGFYFSEDTLRGSVAIDTENGGYVADLKTWFYRDRTLPDTATYAWQMTTPQWPSGWSILFCDPNRCNDPQLRNGTFVMKDLQGQPVDSGEFRIGASSNMVPGRAEVRVTVSPKANPSRTVTLFYYATATASGVIRSQVRYVAADLAVRRTASGVMISFRGERPLSVRLCGIDGSTCAGSASADRGVWTFAMRRAGAYVARIALRTGAVAIPLYSVK